MMAIWWKPGWLRPQVSEHVPDSAQITDQELRPLKALYLRRLYRLVLLNAMPSLNAEQRQLVNHALDSTYRDCASLGVRTQARQMLGLPAR